jgi:hypothetical protein
MGTMERLTEFRDKRWITKAQNRKLMLECDYHPEIVMARLDAIEHKLFWKINDAWDVWLGWIGQLMIWSSILYQSTSLYHGIIWDIWYTRMFFTMILGFVITNTVKPVRYPS